MDDEDAILMIGKELLKMAQSIVECSAVMKEMAEFVEELNVRVCALEAFHERKQ